MRFSSCIHCPFLCGSKSSRRRRSPCPSSNSEDAQFVSSSPSPVSLVFEKKREAGDGKVEVFPTTILKKPGVQGPKDAGKGRVKWMDYLGKELVEIREFEPIESGESENSIEGNGSCMCVIQ